MNEHLRKVSHIRSDMTAFDRERMVDINCEEETHDFPGMMNGKTRLKDTEDETLKHIHKTIEFKRKAVKDLGERIDRQKKRMTYFKEKIEELETEITASDTKLRQQNKKIEDQYQRIQWIKEDMGLADSNDLVECLDMLESIHGEIGSWSKAVEGLKRTVRNWREERILLKEMVKEVEEFIRFQNKIVMSIEDHIHLLETLQEALEILKTTREQIRAFAMSTNIQEMNIKTVSDMSTSKINVEKISKVGKSNLIETEIRENIRTEFDVMITVCDIKTEEIIAIWEMFELEKTPCSEILEIYKDIKSIMKREHSEFLRNTEISFEHVLKEMVIDDLRSEADSVKRDIESEKQDWEEKMIRNDDNTEDFRREWNEIRSHLKGTVQKLHKLSTSLTAKIEK